MYVAVRGHECSVARVLLVKLLKLPWNIAMLLIRFPKFVAWNQFRLIFGPGKREQRRKKKHFSHGILLSKRFLRVAQFCKADVSDWRKIQTRQDRKHFGCWIGTLLTQQHTGNPSGACHCCLKLTVGFVFPLVKVRLLAMSLAWPLRTLRPFAYWRIVSAFCEMTSSFGTLSFLGSDPRRIATWEGMQVNTQKIWENNNCRRCLYSMPGWRHHDLEAPF